MLDFSILQGLGKGAMLNFVNLQELRQWSSAELCQYTRTW